LVWEHDVGPPALVLVEDEVLVVDVGHVLVAQALLQQCPLQQSAFVAQGAAWIPQGAVHLPALHVSVLEQQSPSFVHAPPVVTQHMPLLHVVPRQHSAVVVHAVPAWLQG
jgi:hypothetical protein